MKRRKGDHLWIRCLRRLGQWSNHRSDGGKEWQNRPLIIMWTIFLVNRIADVVTVASSHCQRRKRGFVKAIRALQLSEVTLPSLRVSWLGGVVLGLP
jgi:hypothetical protein